MLTLSSDQLEPTPHRSFIITVFLACRKLVQQDPWLLSNWQAFVYRLTCLWFEVKDCQRTINPESLFAFAIKLLERCRKPWRGTRAEFTSGSPSLFPNGIMRILAKADESWILYIIGCNINHCWIWMISYKEKRNGTYRHVEWNAKGIESTLPDLRVWWCDVMIFPQWVLVFSAALQSCSPDSKM